MHIYYGGSGNLTCGSRALLNISAQSYLIHSAYPTTANGNADEIICPSASYAIQLSASSGYDFARWGITETLDQIFEHAAHYSHLFRYLCILFPGEAEPCLSIHCNVREILACNPYDTHQALQKALAFHNSLV